MNGLDIAVQLQPGDLSECKFSAEPFGLTAHGLGQRSAAGAAHAGIIDHLGCDSDLPAEALFFHNNHAVARPGKIEGSGQSGRTTANDDNVIQVFQLFHGL